MSRYNGWKNRQTWNVALWSGNDEGLYRRVVEVRERLPRKRFTATRAEELARDELFPSGETPDQDSLNGVAWGSIASAWNEF